MSKRSNELREKRAKLHADATEILKKQDLTAEDRSTFDRMMADVDVMKADIDREERAEAIDKELRDTKRPPEAPIGEPGDKRSAVREYRNVLQRHRCAGNSGRNLGLQRS